MAWYDDAKKYLSGLLQASYGEETKDPLSEWRYTGETGPKLGFHPIGPAYSPNLSEIDLQDAIAREVEAGGPPPNNVAPQFDMGKAYRGYDLISGNYGGSSPEDFFNKFDASIFTPSFSSPTDQEGSIQARDATAGAAAAAVDQTVISNENKQGTGPDYTDDYADESDNLIGTGPDFTDILNLQESDNSHNIVDFFKGTIPGKTLRDLSWQNLPLVDLTSNKTAATTGFTPGRSTDKSIGVDEAFFAADPIEGRDLGYLDSSKGSFYDAYMAPQTTGSKAMGWLGSLIGPAMPARTLATWAARESVGDKPKGVGALGQGDRFANLLAAQHYADKGPEGWLQSDFVGNYNPQAAGGLWSPGSQMHQVGSEGDVSATIGDIGAYLGGFFSGDEAEGEENDGGWGSTAGWW